MKITTQWTLAIDAGGKDIFAESFPAQVPGACQLDYAKHAGIPDHKYSDNHKLYEDLKNHFWKYSPLYRSAKKAKDCFSFPRG
ncbi:MAG: hypothetical protein IJU84_09340 [Clostridia bacterium]|nr:hypothetical protein [Clostridia bacterium]